MPVLLIRKNIKALGYLLVAVFIIPQLSGCSIYKNRIMFNAEDELQTGNLRAAYQDAKENYLIQPDDYLKLDVFTNKGEMLIDPYNKMMDEQNNNQRNNQNRQQVKYLVRPDSTADFPMVGRVKVGGLTLEQADSLLEEKYGNYYKDPYVNTSYLNKRVIVLGATGGQVIPLKNENTSLIEVLAQAGGITKVSKVNKIRVIRGDLSNPEVFVVDLSTIQGMQSSIVELQPNDIIYVEPVQNITKEAIRDITPVLGIISNVITLILVIDRRN